MTIQFMLLSAPRSASTWASAWLTTDTSLCLHDPLWQHHYSDLDAIPSAHKRIGIACTGIALFPEFVNSHPAKKIILHRDIAEVDASLERIGLTSTHGTWEGVLDRIRGIHLPWTALFDDPKHIYEYLLDRPFDAARHALLREINMQPAFAKLSIDRSATQRLIRELESARAH